MNAQKRAFTLIEILVVVAIIAVLIAILLPSLSRARMQAKSAVCSSQLKQQGYAAMLYAQDNRGTLPGSYDDAIARLPYKSEPTKANTAFRHPFIYVYKMRALANIFYCPANDILKTPWTTKNFFMAQGTYGNGGDSGRITYWWLANPPPGQGWRFRDTNGVDANGKPVLHPSQEWTTSDTATPKGWTDETMNTLDSKWPRWSTPPMLRQLSPTNVVISTDGSAQKNDGWRFFHGDESLPIGDVDASKLHRSWKNELYGDLHVASVKAFKITERWGPNNQAGW
jgi:prepilin-type N-terminal cleavage/methylation domain-containing protein